MSNSRVPSLVTIFVLFISEVAIGQTALLTQDGEVQVKGNMTHLRDPLDTMDFIDVIHAKMDPLPLPQKSPSFGFDRATHWFKFEIKNNSPYSDWLIEIPYAPLDRVDFYFQPDSGNTWTHNVQGDIFPISKREIRHRHITFNFSIQPGEIKTVYFKVKTISSVQVPLIIWTPEKFQLSSYDTQIINGFFYGAMLIMILYQLFLFASIRDKTTLYYVLTLISMANVISFFQGYTFLFLYPDYPHLNNAFAALSGPFFVIFSALLTRSFLNIKQFSPVLDKIIMINALLDTVIGVLMLAFDGKISYSLHHTIVLLHCVLVLVSAGYCLSKRYRPALYYLLAWVTLLLAAVAFTMGNLGFAPGYLGTNYQGLMMGCILQVLFISFALGERYNVLVKENQAAKELELRRGKEEKERLEVEVKLRTEEIIEQKNKLEELNRIKDKLFSVVSHDIKAPLTSLRLALALTKIDKISHKEFKNISTEIEDHLEKTTEYIQNLLQWAKFQLRGETVKPTKIDLSSIVKESLQLLETDLKNKSIDIQNEIPDGIYAHADPIMIQSVIRNLLSNALKFTPTNGCISVKEATTGSDIIISISDTGMGVDDFNKDKIFSLESLTTPGTDKEPGTGLGLVLCKEFVEKNNGTIWFETETGKGTTFSFSLPIHQEKLNPV